MDQADGCLANLRRGVLLDVAACTQVAAYLCWGRWIRQETDRGIRQHGVPKLDVAASVPAFLQNECQAGIQRRMKA